MTPILYEHDTTTFNTMGIGSLTEASKCTVYESRNGNYELEMVYPIGGHLYDEIEPRRIIYAIPSPHRTPQPFRIFKVEKTLKNSVTVRALHVSYDLQGIPVGQVTATSPASALQGMIDNSLTENPFTVWTNKTGTAVFNITAPDSFKSYLVGRQGSILDVYGTGEYEFDHWNVKLYLHRGTDKGVRIQYGKNVTKLEQDIDISSMITGIVPYWKSEETDTTIIGSVVSAGEYTFSRVKAVDFTAEFETQPTVEELEAKAVTYLAVSENTKPKVAITADFADMSRFSTELSEQLEEMDLCDTVTVACEEFSLNTSAEIVSIETDVLLEKYNKLEIGSIKGTVAGTIASAVTNTESSSEVEGQVTDLLGAVTNLQVGQYYVTPEMYGAKGNGATDDSEAFNAMFADAVTLKKPVRFRAKTYHLGSTVNIPGKVSVTGNSAVLEFDAGINGLVMTTHAAECTFENFIITSTADAYPMDGVDPLADTPGLGTVGFWVASSHAKIDRISINNFGTGLFTDERYLPRTNQTGVIITNCHIRYCGCGARLGYAMKNRLTTDYTITDSTFCGQTIGLVATEAKGYFVDNIHTWGPDDPDDPDVTPMLHGLYFEDCGLTNISNVYVEKTTSYAAYIHSRKSVNIDNFTYAPTSGKDREVITEDPYVFKFDGPGPSGDPLRYSYHVSLDNIAIRSTYGFTAVLITMGNAGVYDIGSVYDTEHNLLKEGEGYIICQASQSWGGYFYHHGDILRKYSPFNRVIGDSLFLGAVKGEYLGLNESGTITYDLSSTQQSQPMAIEVTVTTRSYDNIVMSGKYIVPIYKTKAPTQEGEPDQTILIGTTQEVLNNPNIAVTATVEDLVLSITIDQGQVSGANTTAQVIVEPKYTYTSEKQTPPSEV